MNMDNYPHFTLTEDGRLVSTGQHRPGFPRVLNDALHRLGYNGDDPLYRCSLSTAHGLDMWEVSLTVPFDPTDLWIGTIIGSDLNNTVEQTALVALTSLGESRLAATAEVPAVLFLIRNQEDHNQGDPERQQRLVDMSDTEGPHFHTGVAEMAKYAQYLFNLQHNTIRTIIQQRLLLIAYEQHAEGLRHKIAILHSGTLPPLDQDHELLVTYCCLGNIEHGLNYNRQQLDLAREEVNTHTHAIIHLEHAIEQQDLELEERTATIATLEQ
jgi:hypothetical protein